VKLDAGGARDSSGCECSRSFSRSSERVLDWSSDGKDLAMSSTADVNFLSSFCSSLHHHMQQPSL